MRLNLFESELERLARTLTEQFGVQVVCQGDEAWTDGQRIMLPSLPEPMDVPLERMVVGYLDHEMAHVAFSDFQVVKEFSEKHPGYEAMLNVVEDALIEQRAMQRWPGVRANLDAMFSQIKNRVKQLAEQRDPFGKFCTAVYLKLAHYHDMLGLESQVAGYEDLLAAFNLVQTTQDSADLAALLLERWLKANPPNQPQSEPDGSPDRGASDSGDNAPKTRDGADGESSACMPMPSDNSGPAGKQPLDGKDDTSGTDPPQSKSPSTRETSESKNGPSETSTRPPNPSGDINNRSGAEDPSQQKCGTDGETSSAQNPIGRGGSSPRSLITEALTEAIAESARSLVASSQYRVYTKQFDRIDVVPVANDRDVQQLLKKHAEVIRRLRRGLANALRSAEKRWWRDEQVRGELSSRSLHRLCLDRPQLDVFRTRSSVQGQSTAVSIVLDASGSMTINKMDVARDALRVLLEALDDLSVATEAITFTTGNNASVFTQATQRGEDSNDLRQRYSRIANLEIGLVKRFEEPVKAALKRLPSIRGTGLTPLGEAMMVGAKQLARRRESRRIMLVLTDGRAGCESNDGAAIAHAQSVADRIAKAGMELIGVGILDESLRAIVADTIVVHQLEDLPSQLCKLLSQTLMKGIRHVG